MKCSGRRDVKKHGCHQGGMGRVLLLNPNLGQLTDSTAAMGRECSALRVPMMGDASSGMRVQKRRWH